MPKVYSSGVSRLLSNSGCAAAAVTSTMLRIAKIGQRHVIAIAVDAISVEVAIRWTINAAEAGLLLRLQVRDGHRDLIRQGTATLPRAIHDRRRRSDTLAHARHHVGNERIERFQRSPI